MRAIACFVVASLACVHGVASGIWADRKAGSGQWSLLDAYGISAALTNNGRTMAVGTSSGSTYEASIMDWDDSHWVQRGSAISTKLVNFYVPTLVSLSCDGNVAAVSSFVRNNNSTDDIAITRVFSWNGAWMQRGKDIVGEVTADAQAAKLVLSCDGNVLANSAMEYYGSTRRGGSNNKVGRVRVFAWTGSEWAARGANENPTKDRAFPASTVAVNKDGSVIAISVSTFDRMKLKGRARIQVLMWNGVRYIQRWDDLKSSELIDPGGCSLSLSSDGNTIAIGKPILKAGVVHVLDWKGPHWKARPPISEVLEYGLFATTVQLSGDGSVLAVGSFGVIDTTPIVQVYRWDRPRWIPFSAGLQAEVTAQYRGWTISLDPSGTSIAVGAFNSDGTGTDNGYLRVYDIKSTTL